MPSSFPSATSDIGMQQAVLGAIRHAYEWDIVNWDNVRRYQPKPFADEERQSPWFKAIPREGFSADDLSVVDVRLPDVLNHAYAEFHRRMLTQNKKSYHCRGEDLRYTLQHWETPLLCLPTEAFKAPKKSQPVFYMGTEDIDFKVTSDSDGVTHYTLYFSSCIFTETPGGIVYVSDTFDAHLRLDPDWMEAHYPAWSNNLGVVKALELDGTAVLQQLFPQPASQATVAEATVTLPLFEAT